MPLTKAWIINEDNIKGKVICLFNPEKYTISKSNSWKQEPIIGQDVPPGHFTGGCPRTMNMELFFDKEGMDIRPDLNKLWALALIEETTKNKATPSGRPPLCTLHWGSNWSFKAFITSLSVLYTLFHANGTPLRATATVTFQEAVDAEVVKEKDTPAEEKAGYKKHTVLPRETLDTIAYKEYKNAAEWRILAVENDRDDPLDLIVGEELVIPPLTSGGWGATEAQE